MFPGRLEVGDEPFYDLVDDPQLDFGESSGFISDEPSSLSAKSPVDESP